MDLETIDTILGVAAAAWLFFIVASRWGVSPAIQALWILNLVLGAAYLILSPLVWFGIELAIEGYAALSLIALVEAVSSIVFNVARAGDIVLAAISIACLVVSTSLIASIRREAEKAVHPLDLPVYG